MSSGDKLLSVVWIIVVVGFGVSTFPTEDRQLGRHVKECQKWEVPMDKCMKKWEEKK